MYRSNPGDRIRLLTGMETGSSPVGTAISGGVMKREILTMKRYVSDCCPGHDKFPNDTYRNRRSIHARARDKAKEHRYVRRILKHMLQQDIN